MQKINVHKCTSFLVSDKQQKAARHSLFGVNTVLYRGGWSFHDQKKLTNAIIRPIRVRTPVDAEEVGIDFMKTANKKFSKKKGVGELFPVNSTLFRLRAVEHLCYHRDTNATPVAWKITWQIDAHPGTLSQLPVQKEPWLFVAGAHISLVIGITGQILGGDAHWRPISQTSSVEQLLTAEVMLKDIEQSRQKQSTSDEHNREHGSEENFDSPIQSAKPSVFASYFIGAPMEFCNYIEPRFLFLDGSHDHGPRLEVPITHFGISVSLLQSLSKTSGLGEVLIEPWVVDANGVVDLFRGDVKSYWTFQEFGTDDNTIKKQEGGDALRISGLYEVSFTVQRENGAIAHANLFVSSAIDQGPVTATRPAAAVS